MFSAEKKQIQSNFDLLPDDILIMLLSYLAPRELGTLLRTNQRFNNLIISNPWLWKDACSLVNYTKKTKTIEFKESSSKIIQGANGFFTQSRQTNSKPYSEFSFWESTTSKNSVPFHMPAVLYKEKLEVHSDVQLINKNYFVINVRDEYEYLLIISAESKKLLAVYGDEYRFKTAQDVIKYKHEENEPLIVATRHQDDRHVFIVCSDQFCHINIFDGSKFTDFFQERYEKKDDCWGELKFQNLSESLSRKDIKSFGEICELLFTANNQIMLVTTTGRVIIRDLHITKDEVSISKHATLQVLPGSLDIPIEKAALLEDQSIACGYGDGHIRIYSLNHENNYQLKKTIDCKPEKKWIDLNLHKLGRPIWHCLQIAPTGDIVAGLTISNKIDIINHQDYTIKSTLKFKNTIRKAIVMETGGIVTLSDDHIVTITQYSYENGASSKPKCSIM